MSKGIALGARGARALCVVLLVGSLGWACESTPPTSPSGALGGATSSGPVSSALFVRYEVSGRVTDEAGTPMAGTSVQVAYRRGSGGASNPQSLCLTSNDWCWLKAVTDGSGHYRAEVEAEADPRHPGTFGHVYSYLDGFEANVQFLPTGASAVVRDLRLRSVRTLAAGESTTVLIEPDSSLCSDLEDLWVMTSRCEIVRVVAGLPGTLVVEARASEPGGSTPSIYWATAGDLGGTYQIFVGIPDGEPAQRVEVSASLR